MKKYLWFFVLLLIFKLLFAEFVLADNLFGVESDMLGFKLSMSKDQSIMYAKSKYPGRTVTVMPVEIGFNHVTTKVNAGIAFRPEKSKEMGGLYLSDWLVVMFNPDKNSDDIFAICRNMVFLNSHNEGEWIYRNNFLKGLVDKYGEPDAYFTENTNAVNKEFFYWFTDKASVKQIGNEYAHQRFYLCELPFEPYHTSNGEEISQEISSNYVEMFNSYLQPLGTFKDGGIVLRVCINRTSKNPFDNSYPFVKSVGMTLIDLTRGTSEMIEFKKRLLDNEIKEEYKEYKKEMMNKPPKL